MARQSFAEVPGLFLYPDFFDAPLRDHLLRSSLNVYQRLEEVVGHGGPLERASIPQPTFVRSSQHNLTSEESFVRGKLLERGDRAVRCEYFPRYGEDGHALSYFRGNANLPDFVVDALLGPIRQAVDEARLVKPEQELTWKLTMNFYRSIAGTVAGFPFHVDIPANGVVTMILNIQRQALFQIARGDVVKDVELPVGGLLVLSGESRYEWKHRVLPRAVEPPAGEGTVERVSLVLGFQ